MKNSLFISFGPLLCLLFIILVLSSCGKNKETTDAFEQQSSVSPSLYPHPNGWNVSSSHGTTTLKRLTEGEDDYLGEGCVGCHGNEFQGGAGASCYDCHENFPHKKDWTNSSSSDFHGLKAVSSGIQNACGTQCHGTDFSGGISNTSCMSCHPLFPHLYANSSIQDSFPSSAVTWSDVSVHGAYVQTHSAITRKLCATLCHGTDYTGGLSQVACSSCHAPYPHTAQGSNWTSDHLSFVNSYSDSTCQTAEGCHSAGNTGPSSVVQSCTNFCH